MPEVELGSEMNYSLPTEITTTRACIRLLSKLFYHKETHTHTHVHTYARPTHV